MMLDVNSALSGKLLAAFNRPHYDPAYSDEITYSNAPFH